VIEFVALNAEQLAYARAILLIEKNLEPKCEGCGYGADRPNCAMGGGCGRHDQKDVIAFKRVREQLKRLGNLNDQKHWQWRNQTPIHLLYDFSDKEKSLLLDLHDKGGKQSTRSLDERFDSLGCGSSGKGAVLLSSVGRMWHVELTEQGKAYVAMLLKEEVESA
jgi:hypothetical protein